MDEEDDNESDVIEIKKPCNHHAEFAPTMILLPSSDPIDSAVKSETDEVWFGPLYTIQQSIFNKKFCQLSSGTSSQKIDFEKS